MQMINNIEQLILTGRLSFCRNFVSNFRTVFLNVLFTMIVKKNKNINLCKILKSNKNKTSRNINLYNIPKSYITNYGYL